MPVVWHCNPGHNPSSGSPVPGSSSVPSIPSATPHTTASPCVDQFTVFEVEAAATLGKNIAASTERQAAPGTDRFIDAAYRGPLTSGELMTQAIVIVPRLARLSFVSERGITSSGLLRGRSER